MPGVSSNTIFSSRNLVSFMDAAGTRLGVPVAAATFGQVPRPPQRTDAFPPMVQWCQSLVQPNVSTDMDTIHGFFGIEVPENQNCNSLSPSSSNAECTTLVKMSKMMNKVTLTIAGVGTLMDSFQEEEWEENRESYFTKPVTTIAVVEHESRTFGDGPALQLAQEWAAGLAAVKLFLKLYKDYIKTRRRHERLIEITTAIFNGVKFIRKVLRDKGKFPAPTLEMLAMKTGFYEMAETRREPVSKALNELLKAGMSAVFARAAETA